MGMHLGDDAFYGPDDTAADAAAAAGSFSSDSEHVILWSYFRRRTFWKDWGLTLTKN